MPEAKHDPAALISTKLRWSTATARSFCEAYRYDDDDEIYIIVDGMVHATPGFPPGRASRSTP